MLSWFPGKTFRTRPDPALNIVWGGRGGGALVEKTEVSFCGQCGGCLSKLKVMGGALCL